MNKVVYLIYQTDISLEGVAKPAKLCFKAETRTHKGSSSQSCSCVPICCHSWHGENMVAVFFQPSYGVLGQTIPQHPTTGGNEETDINNKINIYCIRTALLKRTAAGKTKYPHT